MAIIYSYPHGTPTLQDILLGSHIDNDGNNTKSFYISDIVNLVIANLPTPAIPSLQLVTNVGAHTNQPILVEVSDENPLTGISINAFGVRGESTNSIGIRGRSFESDGVNGESYNGTGVAGESVDGAGIYGTSESGVGTTGISGSDVGVKGYSTESFGVYASSGDSYGIFASSGLKGDGSNLWTVPSDERLKENILPYTKGLKDILLVNTVVYDYNGLGGMTRSSGNIGVIAQEIKEIFPETVSINPTKLNETDTDKTDLLAFNGSALTYALINAVKELKAEIELLKAK